MLPACKIFDADTCETPKMTITERLPKQAIFEVFKAREDGDILMNAPTHDSWRQLCKYDAERDHCRVRAPTNTAHGGTRDSRG